MRDLAVVWGPWQCGILAPCGLCDFLGSSPGIMPNLGSTREWLVQFWGHADLLFLSHRSPSHPVVTIKGAVICEKVGWASAEF